jgi:hypothetical protein
MVYVSIATEDMSDKDLQALLKKARASNEILGITGMLLYRDRFFIQALEGEQTVLENLYAIISTDERHRNVILIYEKPIQQRRFPNWTMGFNKTDSTDTETIKGYTDFLQQPTPESFSQYANEVDILLDEFKH